MTLLAALLRTIVPGTTQATAAGGTDDLSPRFACRIATLAIEKVGEMEQAAATRHRHRTRTPSQPQWFSGGIYRRALVPGTTGVRRRPADRANAAGQLVFLPTMASLVTHLGRRVMSLVLAGAVITFLPLPALLMRNRPEDVGLRPYGDLGASSIDPTPGGNPITNSTPIYTTLTDVTCTSLGHIG
jgi:hypothetical protein